MTLLALTGGVGGAKLAQGLAQTLSPDEVVFLVNVGDDFEHLGLYISPDIDTLIYTLAGIVEPIRGWGINDDSFHCLTSISKLGGENWFRLGDRDLATHIFRTQLLHQGYTLSETTERIATAHGVKHTVLPATDSKLRTHLETVDGVMSFQEYFVKHRCRPTVTQVLYHTNGNNLNTRVELSEVNGVVICPSNPFLSVGPIIKLQSLLKFMKRAEIPVVAISPIIGGRALKGPTAKIMNELGLPVSAETIATMYQEFLTGFVIDRCDAHYQPPIEQLGIKILPTQTVMHNLDDKIRLSNEVVEFITSL